MTKPLVKWLALAIIGLTITIAAVLNFSPIKRACCASEFQTLNSPLSDHYLIVYRYASLLALSPGSSGDLPGYVQLYNGQGEQLREKDVEMVQLIQNVHWTENSVTIKFVLDWPLSDTK